VIVTTPLPQAFGLLADSDLELDLDRFRVDYDRTICLLAVLDRPGAVAASGGEQPVDDVFSFIGDNASKGVSSVPAITFHANPRWSEARWDDSIESLGAALQVAARPWLDDARITDHQVKKWRFATPRTISPDPCWTSSDGSVILAGDAFAGPRIEGAHNSGLAAAHVLLR
jgi:renalase